MVMADPLDLGHGKNRGCWSPLGMAKVDIGLGFGEFHPNVIPTGVVLSFKKKKNVLIWYNFLVRALPEVKHLFRKLFSSIHMYSFY